MRIIINYLNFKILLTIFCILNIIECVSVPVENTPQNVKPSDYDESASLPRHPSEDDMSVGISGGRVAYEGELSFVVYVNTKIIADDGQNGEKLYRGRCSGNIISNDVILTVAHCFDVLPGDVTIAGERIITKKATYVYIDSVDLKKPTRKEKPKNSDAFEVIIHPGHTNYRCDIALVIVPDLGIEPIALAGDPITEGRRIRTAGYGLLGCGGAPSDVLRHVRVYVLSWVRCGKIEAERRGANPSADYLTQRYETVLCAGRTNEDGPKRGDSGGPLFTGHETAQPRVLEGLVAQGQDCSFKQDLAWFTRVSLFVDWIQQATNCYDCYTIAVRCHKCSSPIEGFCGMNFNPSHDEVETVTCVSKGTKPYCMASLKQGNLTRGCGDEGPCLPQQNIECLQDAYTKDCSLCCLEGAHCNDWGLLKSNQRSSATSGLYVVMRTKFMILIILSAYQFNT